MFSGLYDQLNQTYRDETTKYPVFQHHRERVILGLDTHANGERNITISNAIEAIPHYGLLKSSTRDVYLRGTVEKYDFCTELLDSTPGPFPLECLQNEFIRHGGQNTGVFFPSNETLAFWNSKKRWSEVKNVLQNLVTQTLSHDIRIRDKAMKDFYGVGVQKESLGIEPEHGVEVFWFTHHIDITKPTTFIGRRIRPTIPFLNTTISESGSFIFFTSIVSNTHSSAKYKINSTGGFSLYFNHPITRVYNNKSLSTSSELASLHNGSSITLESNLISLTPNINRLSGYVYYGKGSTYYKIDIQSNEFGPEWKEIPYTHLQMIQEPFAPMISFEVERSPQTWGCDYPLCDKRLSGFKMKWENDGWGGPSIQYRGESIDQKQFPLRKNCLSFPSSKCAIRSKFSIRISSFTTLTLLLTIQSDVKSTSVPFSLWGPAGSPSLHMKSVGNGFVSVNVGTFSGVITRDGPLLEIGYPYLITFTMIRKTELDPIEGIQIGAARASFLQGNPNVNTIMKYSSIIKLPDLMSTEPAYFKIQSESMAFDLFWIHLFDYKLENGNLYRESRADWGYLP